MGSVEDSAGKLNLRDDSMKVEQCLDRTPLIKYYQTLARKCTRVVPGEPVSPPQPAARTVSLCRLARYGKQCFKVRRLILSVDDRNLFIGQSRVANETR